MIGRSFVVYVASEVANTEQRPSPALPVMCRELKALEQYLGAATTKPPMSAARAQARALQEILAGKLSGFC